MSPYPHPTANLPSAWRSNNFDLLRFLFASAVIVTHSYALVRPNQSAYEPLYAFSGGQTTIGSSAVHGFFIMSGYLVTLSWWRSRTVGEYLFKRAMRILPAFLLLQLVTVLVITPLVAPHPERLLTREELFRFVALVGSLNGYGLPETFAHDPKGSWNWSLWTIQYEAWCYLTVVLLSVAGLLSTRWRALATLGVAVTLAALSEWRPFDFNLGILHAILGTPQHWTWLMPAFLCGVCFYWWRDSIPLRGTLALAAVAVYILACRVPPAVHIIGLPALAYVIFWLAHAPWIRASGFGKYGDFSYGIYLWAMPMQHLVVLAVGTAVSPWIITAAAFPLALVCGVISWHLVEKHALTLKHARLAGSRLQALSFSWPRTLAGRPWRRAA